MRMHGHVDPPYVRRVGQRLVIYANGGVARVTVGWRLTSQLEALFRAERFDIVHVHGGLNPTLGIFAPRAAWRSGVPVVGTFQPGCPRPVGLRLLPKTLQRSLRRDGAA